MRVPALLLAALLSPLALAAVATPAAAAPEPCVTVLDPTNPGYAAPTCPVSVVRDLLP